jgi:hypothetical protein
MRMPLDHFLHHRSSLACFLPIIQLPPLFPLAFLATFMAQFLTRGESSWPGQSATTPIDKPRGKAQHEAASYCPARQAEPERLCMSTFIKKIFSSAIARRGGPFRRSLSWIDRLASRQEVTEVAQALGFQIDEIGDQWLFYRSRGCARSGTNRIIHRSVRCRRRRSVRRGLGRQDR